jgi:hypothetical protein
MLHASPFATLSFLWAQSKSVALNLAGSRLNGVGVRCMVKLCNSGLLAKF